MGKPVLKFPIRFVATEIVLISLQYWSRISFASKRMWFVLLVCSKKKFLYVMNKYLLLLTPN
jgi:hypothetical protein